MTTPDGRLQWCNGSFERLFGYAIKEIAGRRPFEFLRGSATTRKSLNEFGCEMICERDYAGEIQLRCKNGAQVWVSLRINPIYDDEGYIEHFIWSAREMSHFSRLRAEYRDLLDFVCEVFQGNEPPFRS